MTARDEIENVYSLYAWAFDMDDLALLGNMFTHDAVVEVGNGRAVGRADILADFEKRRAAFRRDDLVPWHLMSNIYIVRGAELEAFVRCFYTLFVKRPSGSVKTRGIGYYEDLFAQDAGVWRIRRRRVISGGKPDGGPWVAAPPVP